MGVIDFPAWFALGSYGGLACSVASTVVIALYAFGRRRGSSRQLVAALEVCLVASVLMFGPIWWAQNRLDVYGPTLDVGEVALALVASVALGWLAPLATLSAYVVLAKPSSLGLSSRYPAYHVVGHVAGAARVSRVSTPRFADVDDPARRRAPLAEEQPWGRLVPLDEANVTAGRPLPLVYELTLLGRELDNDVVIDDERTSRHHAEIHWDHGHPQLLDRASMNGALLNWQATRGYTPLQSGDILELGAQRYRYETLVVTALRLEDEETRKVRGLTQTAREPEAPTLELVALTSGASEQSLAPTQPHDAPSPDGLPSRWALHASLITIGRDQQCTIVLTDPSVSRLHAQIVRQPGGFFVSDLRSSNGAWLNGEKLIAPTQIHPGDVLRIGEVTLICAEASQASPTAQATLPPVVELRAASPASPEAADGAHSANSAEASGASNGNGASTLRHPPELQTLEAMAAPAYAAHAAPTTHVNHLHLAPPHLLPGSSPAGEQAAIVRSKADGE
ncbi:MAG: FHA domain-containing protein [Ktedonobacterales bacterium]